MKASIFFCFLLLYFSKNFCNLLLLFLKVMGCRQSLILIRNNTVIFNTIPASNLHLTLFIISTSARLFSTLSCSTSSLSGLVLLNKIFDKLPHLELHLYCQLSRLNVRKMICFLISQQFPTLF